MLVRFTGYCPFVPTSEIERLLAAHRETDADYTTNWTDAMPIGTAVDVIDSDVLAALSERGETHPVKRLRTEQTRWEIAETPAAEWTQYGSIHMAVDTPDDYWTLSDAVETVGEQPSAIASYLAG